MSRRARVKSIDALQAMAAAMECFRADATSAMDDLEMQIRRAVEWINHECRQYWTEEVRQGWQRMYEAQVQLQQAMTYRRVAEHQPACPDERKAVQQAKLRLQTAQITLEAVAHWALMIDRAINEYRANRAHLVNWLDSDLPQAVAVLGRMTSALETYITLGAPLDELSPIKWATTSPAPEKTGEGAVDIRQAKLIDDGNDPIDPKNEKR
jgi:hypothetical protein